ncbi:NIN-like protein [Tanacetum coccineum]
MALFSHLHSVDFSYEGKSFGLGMTPINDILNENISLEPPSVAFSGESRYLTPLWVLGKADELSQSTTSGDYELMAAKIDPHNQIVEDKIKAALKLLTFREQRVVVQFWSPRVVGQHQLLTTIDQPFGLGVHHDESLLSYRRASQHNLYVVDKDYDEVNESRLNELEKIFNIMKVVCDTHQLPLAQTWALSPLTSVASYEQVLEKSCNSYDSRCLGKVCMSTCALPDYVQDLGLWPFREECKKQHLDKSRGFISRALLSGGSCFCEDVTKLSEEVYPLVQYARMSGLVSCFAIYLHGLESNNDYVLEFFLPSHMKESLLNLVQMLKQNLEVASGFKLGDKSSIEVVGPPMGLCVNKEPNIIETSSYMMDAFSDVSAIVRTKFVNVPTNALPLTFRFCLSLGLLKLKNKVAKRFKLESQLIRLKYKDEDNDLILLCGDYDLQPALVASGSNKTTINLICELSA